MGGGDNLHDSVISNTRQENARRQTPEKFQPETYGLEDDKLVFKLLPDFSH